MLRTFEGGAAGSRRQVGRRFSCIVAGQSSSTELLHGCPVVTATGQMLGRVRSILVDTRSRQLRYVVLAPRGGKGSVAIPWHALYFDSAMLRLVYYTYS